jgi:hypothetical protein
MACKIGLSRGLGLLGPNPVGLSRELGLLGPNPVGLLRGLGLLGPNPRSGSCFRGLGLLGPNPVGLLGGLGLLGPEETRSGSGLDSGSWVQSQSDSQVLGAEIGLWFGLELCVLPWLLAMPRTTLALQCVSKARDWTGHVARCPAFSLLL